MFKMTKTTMLLTSIVVFWASLLILAMAIICSWGIREKAKYLREWKTTYESQYCPTCGSYLGE